MVVDQVGEVLGRPWLTTIVDTYSRCIMGIHLGMEAPSAVVVASCDRSGDGCIAVGMCSSPI